MLIVFRKNNHRFTLFLYFLGYKILIMLKLGDWNIPHHKFAFTTRVK